MVTKGFGLRFDLQLMGMCQLHLMLADASDSLGASGVGRALPGAMSTWGNEGGNGGRYGKDGGKGKPQQLGCK